jgi:hypothetical protein
MTHTATNDKLPTHPLPPMTSAPVASARVACCRATLLLAAARAAAEDSMVPVRRFVMSRPENMCFPERDLEYEGRNTRVTQKENF